MTTTPKYNDIHDQLIWLCDAMIPGDANLDFPSASEVQVQDQLLPLALRSRPDLAPAFLMIVSRFPKDRPAEPLDVIRELSPDDRALVGRFIAGAYFSSARVMDKLGYPGFKARPFTPDSEAVSKATRAIRARGECFKRPRPA